MITKVYDEDDDAPFVIKQLLMLKGRFTVVIALMTVVAFGLLATTMDDANSVFWAAVNITGMVVLCMFSVIQVLVIGATLSDGDWSW